METGLDELEVPGSYRDWSSMAASSSAPERCQFLRSIAPDGRLYEPGREAVASHRCAAFGDPLPLSLRQQELVCLQRVHASCPRYMRGTLLAEELSTTMVAPRSGRGFSATALATLTGVGLMLVIAIAVVAAMMGLMPAIGPAPADTSPVVVASPTATATPVESATPTASPTARLSPSPTATSAASPTWPPGATESRMVLLKPCAGEPDCWVYTVRGPGPEPSGNGSSVADTLKGICAWFGVSETVVINMNPWAENGVIPGDELKIPPPTR